MLWPRSCSRERIGAPRQRAARSADPWRYAPGPGAGTTGGRAGSATERAMLLVAGLVDAGEGAGFPGTGDAVAATACRASSTAIASAAGVAGGATTEPGVTAGLSHHCGPHAGMPARQPCTLPPNATMVRDRYGHSGCPRPDAVAEAHPADGIAERTANRSGQRLDGAGRQVRPVVQPGLQRAAAGACEHVPHHEADDHRDEEYEPLRQGRWRVCLKQARGRVFPGPICIGGTGGGRRG